MKKFFHGFIIAHFSEVVNSFWQLFGIFLCCIIQNWGLTFCEKSVTI